MRACACANIKYSSGATLNRNSIEFGKSVRVKELSGINWRICYPVVTAQNTVSIFLSVQVIEHCLSVKFHIWHFLFLLKSPPSLERRCLTLEFSGERQDDVA